jgi:hypothetical protein
MKRNGLKVIAILLIAMGIGGAIALSREGKVAAASATSDPHWGALQFLSGTWVAAIDGKPESSSYTFAPEMNGHELVRRCSTGCNSGPMGPGYSDVLYIYKAAADQPYRAIFFDTEGHVLQYEISTPSANKAVFLSDGSVPGPRFQLTYELDGGTMNGKFEMLPPGGGPARQLSAWSGTKR